MTDKLKVFLCHATENKPIVNGLFDDLVAAGFDPWLDTDDILPGMAPDMVIQKALRECDIVIICLSSISVAKEGYVQKEIRWARNIQDEKPEDTIFVIPLRLDNCKVPFSLKEIQWGDYTAPDGYEKLVKSLNRRAEQLGKTLGDSKKKRP
jgi:TIR domain-containing protein